MINISRGERAPYQPHGAWKSVRTLKLSREAEEEAGAFGRKIRELRPDIVIDMICFREASARYLVEALRFEKAALAQACSSKPPLQLDRGRVRICELADGERDRADRSRSGLTGSCRAARSPRGRRTGARQLQDFTPYDISLLHFFVPERIGGRKRVRTPGDEIKRVALGNRKFLSGQQRSLNWAA